MLFTVRMNFWPTHVRPTPYPTQHLYIWLHCELTALLNLKKKKKITSKEHSHANFTHRLWNTITSSLHTHQPDITQPSPHPTSPLPTPPSPLKKKKEVSTWDQPSSQLGKAHVTRYWTMEDPMLWYTVSKYTVNGERYQLWQLTWFMAVKGEGKIWRELHTWCSVMTQCEQSWVDYIGDG